MANENVLDMAKNDFEEEEDDDEIDETLAERLWGLTEMFPERVQRVLETTVNVTWSAARGAYSFSRSALWIIASSATIMVLPVVFESERAQQQQQELQQQRQILLGPNAAMAGGASHNMLPGMAMSSSGMPAAAK